MNKMQNLDLQGKRVLIRVDLNVPLAAGKITSDTRIRAVLPTIKRALNMRAAVLLLSHLGRPKEGEFNEVFSLAPVALRLTELLGQPVRMERDYLNGVAAESGEVVLCENVRFNVGEKSDDENLAKQYAGLADVFVMDAFATAHRAHASTHGVAKFSKLACAGPLLIQELDALGKALENPAKPMMAIVGGAKVSTKLEVLDALIEKVGVLVVGGGMANTFLAAQDFPVGKSLYEPERLAEAKRIFAKADLHDVSMPLPTDVVVASELSSKAEATVKQIANITSDDMILDIGPESIKALCETIKNMQTIIWNGPVGVFEFEQFAAGTQALGQALATSSAFTLAGGGDTIAAIEQFNIAKNISYISTGGGAFLEFVEGKTLPGVAVLN